MYNISEYYYNWKVAINTRLCIVMPPTWAKDALLITWLMPIIMCGSVCDFFETFEHKYACFISWISCTNWKVFIEMIYIFFVAEETRDMMVLVLLSVLIVFLATWLGDKVNL